MDILLNHLSESQIKHLNKKNKNLLYELQKDIHSHKIEYYDQLRRFFWTVSAALLVSFFCAITIYSPTFLLVYIVLILFSFAIAIIGGKLYYIDKVSIAKKTIAKSKFLDAMEIETLNPGDIKKKKIGLYLIISSGIIFSGAIITIIIIK